MNVDEYLKRINSLNYKANTLQGLYRLQQNHLLNIPFENLDIHLGKNIESDLTRIYEKIILNRRGGICCELNYLFSWLLKELGFLVNILSCQIKKDDSKDEWSSWDSHCVLMVHINESCFLVDVGFTQNYRTPIKFVIDKIQIDVTGYYKILQEDTNIFTLFRCLDYKQNDLNNEWLPIYKFNTQPKQTSYFYELIDNIRSNNDRLRLNNFSLCVIHTTYSVLNLVGHRLSEIKFSNSIKKSVTDSILTKAEVFDAIKNIYGISLGENEVFEPVGD